MSATRVLVLGARQYAPVFLDVFQDVGDHQIVGFLENLDRSICEQSILGLPVHWIDDVASMAKDHKAICCLATPERSAFIAQAEALGFSFATLVHPTAWVSRRSTLSPGVSLDVNSVVAGFSRLGPHVRVGRGATIGHHTSIGAFCTIHPSTAIAGNCVLEEKVTVGIGSTIIDGCRVGAGSFVAAGASVTNDVPPGVLVGGVPAKVLRKLEEVGVVATTISGAAQA